MKYKEGDRVLIAKKECRCCYVDPLWVGYMDKYVGRTMTIKKKSVREKNACNGGNWMLVEDGGGGWTWSDCWFIPIKHTFILEI